MSSPTTYLKRLLSELVKLPGIGPKSAQRIAFHILKMPLGEAKNLALSILKARQQAHFCPICNNLTEARVCPVCQDSRRDRSVICVVEEPKDILSIEETGVFRGLYHVLLGSLSALEGIGPKDIKINGLLSRVKQNKIKEVIIATDSDAEGETTALYLTQVLRPFNIRLTRIAYGIPMGSSLEYADQPTLAKAIEGRREI
jgi:recombination protein RecR